MEVVEEGDEPVETAASRDFPSIPPRILWAMLILGILLRLISFAFATIGVDAHVHIAYASSLAHEGNTELEWGPINNYWNHSASHPNSTSEGVGNRYILWHAYLATLGSLGGWNETTFKVASLFHSALFLGTVWVATQRRYGRNAALQVTAIASCHQLLILVAVQSYQEEILATIMVGAVWSFLAAEEQRKEGTRPTWILVTSLCTIAFIFIKGMGIYLLLALALIGLIWFFVITKPNSRALDFLRRRKWIAIGYAVLLLWGAMLVAGFFDITPVWHRLKMNPTMFVLAFFLSIIAYMLWWGLMSFILLPHLPEMLRRLTKTHSPISVIHLSMITIIPLAFIILTNAGLWTHEAGILDVGLFVFDDPRTERPFGGWSNGRYLTIMLVPAWWLLLECRKYAIEGDDDDIEKLVQPFKSIAKSNQNGAFWVGSMWVLVIATMLTALIPPAFFIAHHHPVEASKAMGEVLEDGEEFLVITYPRQNHHRLYQLRLGIDPDDSRNIMGHWRDNEAPWASEIEDCLIPEYAGDIRSVDWIAIWKDVPALNVSGYVIRDIGMPEGWTVMERTGSPTCPPISS